MAVDALTGGDVDAYEEAKHAIADCIEVEVDALGLARRRTLGATTSAACWPSPYRDGVISRAEMRHLGYQLLVAGHETTTSLIGLMLYRLIERPDVMARLRADPAPRAPCRRGGTAVRLAGPGAVPHERLRVHDRRPDARPADARCSCCSVRPTGIRSSARIPTSSASTATLNELRRHVAFGWGIHFCIGAPLARLEARLTFERILARMDDIELAGAPRRNESFVLRGSTSLPLRWKPRH